MSSLNSKKLVLKKIQSWKSVEKNERKLSNCFLVFQNWNQLAPDCWLFFNKWVGYEKFLVKVGLGVLVLTFYFLFLLVGWWGFLGVRAPSSYVIMLDFVFRLT